MLRPLLLGSCRASLASHRTTTPLIHLHVTPLTGAAVHRRAQYGHKDTDVAIPPLGMSALTWGLFMGVSSNLRYQAVFGAERLVDRTLARKLPQLAYVTSTVLRFGNNVVGGEQFVDLARWTGVQ